MKRTLLSLLLTVCLLLLPPSAAFAASAPAAPFDVLHEALAQLAQDNATPEPAAIGGDWTVFTLARAGLWQPNSPQVAAYYARVVKSVDEAAAKTVRKDGAMHDLKSTDNARTILALSALGKDPHQVGAWDLLRPYEDFDWIKKQSYNAVAYALLALNSGGYETADPTIRTRCVDFLVQSQFEDGGWSIWGKRSDVDITAIVLQGLAAYREDPAVAAAGERGFACLSAAQNESGGFSTIGTENTESAAQVVLACCAWGIDPAAEPRLQKDGITPVDCLLRAYRPEAHAFAHTADDERPAMQATEQACYALLAYERLVNGQPFLFDCTDVPLTADIAAPEASTDVTELTEPPTAPAAEATDPTDPAALPTEPATETKTAPADETTADAETTTVPASAGTPATRPAATTAAPEPTADRTEATPHTGDDHAVFAAVLLLGLGTAALALSRKKEARHAS